MLAAAPAKAYEEHTQDEEEDQRDREGHRHERRWKRAGSIWWARHITGRQVSGGPEIGFFRPQLIARTQNTKGKTKVYR